MRELTLREVNEQYGGILPPDAVLRPDDAEITPSAVPQPHRPKGASSTPKRRNRSERFAVLNTFVDFGIVDSKLTPAEVVVWLVLYRDTKGDGTARTAQADIARRAGLNVRTVRRAVAVVR